MVDTFEKKIKDSGNLFEQNVSLKLVRIKDTSDVLDEQLIISKKPIFFYEESMPASRGVGVTEHLEREYHMEYLNPQASMARSYLGYQWRFDNELEISSFIIDFAQASWGCCSSLSIYVNQSTSVELKANDLQSFKMNVDQSRCIDLFKEIASVDRYFENTLDLKDYLQSSSSEMTLIFEFGAGTQLFRRSVLTDANRMNNNNINLYPYPFKSAIGLSPKFTYHNTKLENLNKVRKPSPLLLNRYDFDSQKWPYSRVLQFVHETRNVSLIHSFPYTQKLPSACSMTTYTEALSLEAEEFNKKYHSNQRISDSDSESFRQTTETQPESNSLISNLPLFEKIRYLKNQPIETLVDMLPRCPEDESSSLLSDLIETMVIHKLTDDNIEQVEYSLLGKKITHSNINRFCLWYSKAKRLIDPHSDI